MHRRAVTASVLAHAAAIGAVVLAVAPAPADARWQSSRASRPARVEWAAATPVEVPPPPVPAVDPERTLPDAVAAAEPAPAPFAPPQAVPEPAELPHERAVGAQATPPALLRRLVPAPSPPLTDARTVDAATAPAAAPSAAAEAAEAAFVDAVPDARNTPPEYPPEARRTGVEGTVRVALDVDAAGAVTAARVVVGSGHRLLDRAALQALRRWRFAPARRGTLAVPGRYERDVVFRLLDSTQ
jgi:protein TonB